MKFDFKWHTSKFDQAQKNELAEEIEQKVTKQLKQVVKGEVESITFDLYECTTKDCLITGEGVCIEGQKKRKVKIKIDNGFLIRCENSSWFQPRTPSPNH